MIRFPDSAVSSFGLAAGVGPAQARPVAGSAPGAGAQAGRGEPGRSQANAVPPPGNRPAAGSTRVAGAGPPQDPAAERPKEAADGQGQQDGQEASPAQARKPDGSQLSEAELRELALLKKIDAKVRAHEMAHLAAAGAYARGGASFQYKRGPDGRNYAVGGEVPIDTSKEATPEETIAKMRQVRAAALAPADPSPQDLKVASSATAAISEAQKELRMLELDARMRAVQRRPAEEGAQMVSGSGSGQGRGVPPAQVVNGYQAAAGGGAEAGRARPPAFSRIV